jgi:hypothetical protein
MAAKRWNTCNVLATGAETLRLWQFDAKGNDFKLGKELTLRAGETPPSFIAKSWSDIWSAKLNVACLPTNRVFLRVAQFPNASFAETLAMVDLQMEKLSPMPVGQVVWTIHCLPHPSGEQQTVIVTIAARDVVEEYLGKLEAQGYLADRLEIPALDQLLATDVKNDGAWIYPEALGGHDSALVAWWYGGVLQSLDLLSMSSNKNEITVGLAQQLSQMAWSGEVSGWLTSRPKWHLVIAPGVTPIWEMALRGALNEPIELLVPLNAASLAAHTAKRAAKHEASATLMPLEVGTRYRQQFYDGLWMRGLGAAFALYLVGVVAYFGWFGVSWFRTSSIESKVLAQSQTYSNAVELRNRYAILKDRQELKFAALDLWKLIAEKSDSWPNGVTLEGYTLNDGQRLTVNGSAPQDAVTTMLDFSDDFRKSKGPDGKPLFTTGGSPFSYRPGIGNSGVTWNFTVELQRTEVQRTEAK